MATRSAVEESFGQPVHLSSIDDGVGQHQDPVLSFDGGTVFFERDNEIFSVESSALDGVPATPKRLALNEPGIRQFHPYPSHDGERLYFARTAGVTDGLPYEIWYARRVGADYGNPEAVLGMQAPGEHRFWPVVSRDELTIYFSAYPVGDIGAAPAYLARRPSIDEPFGQAVLLRGEEFDVPFPIEGTISWVSPDDCEMWLRLPYPLDLAGVTMAHRPTLQ
jgi:hypothetical protein